MKRIRILTLSIIAVSTLTLLAGVIKFNFFDVPFVGFPHVYISDAGETVEAHEKADGSLEVFFLDTEGDYLKSFSAQPTLSASGAQYQSSDGRFVFWSKGDSASVYHQNGELIFQGTKIRSRVKKDTKETGVSGRLVFGHEAHTFQPCGKSAIFWVADPNNILLERYASLTQNKEPYSEVYAELIGSVTAIDSTVNGFAEGFDSTLTVTTLSVMAPLENHPACTASRPKDPLYFSQSTGVWRDDAGICNTCTPENGFGADGKVDHIIWRELHVSLKNDAAENPGIEEVQTFFQAQYAEESGYYPVRVTKNGDVFLIQVPVPKELWDMDFFDYRGALLATYDAVKQSQ